MEILTGIPVELKLEQMLGRLRVGPGSEDAKAVGELLEGARAVVKPKAMYDVFFVGEKTTDTVEIGGALFKSRVLRVNLEKAHRAFAYVATCGRELDEALGGTDDPLRRYWLEEVKLAALGAAMGFMQQHLEGRYRPGKMSRMNPGSLEDWPITQQTELFSLLGEVEGRIGVRLTDSYLMVPTKSVSGILFPTEVSFESCRLCPRKVCPGRQAPYDEKLWEERYAVRG